MQKGEGVKILFAHNSYQQPGGEDAVVAAEVALLAEHGHRVTTYRRSNEELSGGGLVGQALAGVRTIWSSRSHRELINVLAKEKPDVAHFHNTFPLISPAAYYACEEAGVPVVQTLHNYRLLCPEAMLLRDGKVCEACLRHQVAWPGIAHGCYRGSRPATAAVAAMQTAHRAMRTWQTKVNVYVALSEFARRKFIEGGLPGDRIVVKPNFVAGDVKPRTTPGKYALFVGRLSEEKGTGVLLSAWRMMRTAVPLRIVGDGPLLERLSCEVRESSLPWVELTGRRPPEEVRLLMREARFLISPSICYENFPLAIAESFACAVPVVASRLGAMEEIVQDGVTGLHFSAGNAADLAAKAEWAWNHSEELTRMGLAAREKYEANYSSDKNYEMLVEIYRRTMKQRATICEGGASDNGMPGAGERRIDCGSVRAGQFRVLGVRVAALQIPQVVQQIERWIEDRKVSRFISVANTHVVMEAQQDSSFKKLINSADLCLPDGMPLIWCGRFRGHQLSRRVYGPELMSTFCRGTVGKGYRHFFYGGAPDVTHQLVNYLGHSCPGIQIAGAYSPPFRALTREEDEEAIAMINDARPDVLWVGLGCPKQERWIHEHRERLTVPAMVAVGQAFDLLSGRKKPAPIWMSENGLEWFFRLLQEPRRLWRRYLVYNAKFVYSISLELLGVRRFD